MTTRAENRQFESYGQPWRGIATVFAIAALALASASGAWGTTIHVDITNTSGTEDGSEDYPYNTIQEGINNATDGDTVEVDEGTYRECLTITSLDIILTAAETDDPDSYVIDADTDTDGTGNGVAILYDGVVSDGEIVGFKIRNGVGGGISGGSSHNNKGYYEAPVDVRYCVIQDCTASRGAGLACITGTVEYCTFTDNVATVGGAASNDTLRVGVFANNLVYDNEGSETNPYYGVGGVQGFKYVLNNTFHSNVGYWGAAIDECTVARNNLIYDNASTKGAVSNVLILEGNTIYGNTTGASGVCAGVFLTPDYFLEPVVRNNIIWGNNQVGTTTGQQLRINDVTNDWNNYGQLVEATVWNNCIQHGWTAHYVDDDVQDITSVDPELADPDSTTAPDFHLTSSSTSCIDEGCDISGSSYQEGVYEDRDSDPRPIDGDQDSSADFDIGADEYYSGAATAPHKQEIVLSTTPSVTMTMVWIPKGKYLMGCFENETDSSTDEAPQHDVVLTRGFWMSESEVTQEQWETMMSTTPWADGDYVLDNDDCPAVFVDWQDAQAFVLALNGSISGPAFALPTEAQWEYACRAGTATRFYWGDDDETGNEYSDIDDHAWHRGNAYDESEYYAHLVKQQFTVGIDAENDWDLFDMSGNVWEWCRDGYDDYTAGMAEDPLGPTSSMTRVARGGSWHSLARSARSASRTNVDPGGMNFNLGFRVVRAGGYAAKPCVDSFSLDDECPTAELSSGSVDVELNATCTGRPTQYMASESSSFSGATWASYSAASPPTITLSTASSDPVVKTVYFKVRNADQTESAVVSDSIYIATPKTLSLGGGVDLVMKWVGPGTFLMGANPGDPDAYSDESPQHQVTLSTGFWIGQCEVTKAQWQQMMATTPWSGQSNITTASDSPAVYVDWGDAQDFVDELNDASLGYAFSLPTEAQWEYACRAGTRKRYYWGQDWDNSDIDTQAWWDGNTTDASELYAHSGGDWPANALGLYDMSGNVWEWCNEVCQTYPTGPVTDPGTAPTLGTQNVVVRGGCWDGPEKYSRSTRRVGIGQSTATANLGFRVCMVAE